MELSPQLLPAPINLRFYGDYQVRINLKSVAGFSQEQLRLLHSILGSPAAIHELARLALETDLASLTGAQLTDRYDGPSDVELLNCVLKCLPEADRPYWQTLMDGPGDTLHNEIMPVFFTFEAVLKRTGIDELSSSSEATTVADETAKNL